MDQSKKVPPTQNHLSAIGGSDSGGAPGHTRPGQLVQGSGCGALLATALAQDPWQPAGYLGWGQHSSLASHQGFSDPKGSQSYFVKMLSVGSPGPISS